MLGDRGLQELNDIVPLDAGAYEALGPGGEVGLGQTVLHGGEAEGETEVVAAAQEVVALHEVEQAVAMKSKRSLPGPNIRDSLT